MKKPKLNISKNFEFRRPNRSSKYHPSYADELFKHLSAGFSVHTFSIPEVSHTTIMQWIDTNPEFRHALIEGEKARRKLVEAVGLKLMRDGNTVAWKTLLSQYEVTDRVQVEEKHEVKLTVDPDSKSPKRLERLEKIKQLMADLESTSKKSDVLDIEVTPEEDEFHNL